MYTSKRKKSQRNKSTLVKTKWLESMLCQEIVTKLFRRTTFSSPLMNGSIWTAHRGRKCIYVSDFAASSFRKQILLGKIYVFSVLNLALDIGREFNWSLDKLKQDFAGSNWWFFSSILETGARHTFSIILEHEKEQLFHPSIPLEKPNARIKSRLWHSFS